jgi:hypothetical protein
LRLCASQYNASSLRGSFGSPTAARSSSIAAGHRSSAIKSFARPSRFDSGAIANVVAAQPMSTTTATIACFDSLISIPNAKPLTFKPSNRYDPVVATASIFVTRSRL